MRIFGWIIMREETFLDSVIMSRDDYRKVLQEVRDNVNLVYFDLGKQEGKAEARGMGTILSVHDIQNMVDRS